MYNCTINLNQNVKNTVAFLAQKVLISDKFSVVSYELEMHKSLLHRTND